MATSCMNQPVTNGSCLIPYEQKGKWGYIDTNSKKVIISCQYQKAYPFIHNRAKVENWNSEYAIIDTLGNFIAEFKYQEIKPFSEEGYAIVEKDRYKGIIDTTGEEIVSCKYDEIDTFVNSLAKVNLNGKYGCIDKTGNEVLPCKYTDLKICNYGIIQINQHNRYGYFNKNGQSITPFKYRMSSDFYDGLAAVYVDNKGGYIDTTGKEIIPLKYDRVEKFSEGMAGFQYNGKSGYMNTSGKIVFLEKFGGLDLRPYSSGLAAFAKGEKNSKWGFIDKNGQVAIPFMYDYADSFHGNLAVVMLDSIVPGNEKCAVINKKNEQVIPFTRHYIQIDSDSLLIFSTLKFDKPQYGLYNSKGEELLPCEYDEIKRISPHLFKISQQNNCGVADTKGAILHPVKYNLADNFSEGLMAIWDNDQLGFMNESGEIIIPLKYGINGTMRFLQDGFCLVYATSAGKFIHIDTKGNEYKVE